MELWYVIKERYILVAILMLILFISLILMFATWKKRSIMPKSLVGIMLALAISICGMSFIALLFVISFGYNASL